MSPGSRRPVIQPTDSNSPLLPAPPCVSNEDLWQQVQDVKGTTNEILVAMKGNKLGTKGLIPRVDELEVKQEETDRKLIKWAGIGAGFAVAMGLIKDWIFHKS